MNKSIGRKRFTGSVMRQFLIILLFVGNGIGQEDAEAIEPAAFSTEHIRVFIDYAESDNTERFIRREIPFVDYVRNPNLAELHIFITDQSTGSNGKRHTISFIGREKFLNQDQELSYYTLQSATDIERREGLVQIIKMGLMRYVAQTTTADQMKINYHAKNIKPVSELMADPWDFWVFQIEFGGGARAEESIKGYALNGAVNANRITEAWKYQNEFNLVYEEEQFSQDNESLTSILKLWEARSLTVKSLSERWSIGFDAKIYSSSYKNIGLGLSLAPALEYNIYPWVESERRKFSIGYRIGHRWYRYIAETIYDQYRQNLWYHTLDLELEMSQPWGEIDFEVEGLQYLSLKDNYSIQFNVQVNIRLSTAWSLILETKLENIHDQIYLPKGDASIDEILLKRRQLATTYDFQIFFGLRYTFGSIYNNIINERM